MNEQFWWFLARSSGIVAWALLVASVALGLVLSTRALGKRPTPAWSLDLHRGVSGLAVVLTVVHLAALVLDSYVEFGVAELLVPMASSWRPLAVTWGVVALYLLVAIELSSVLRTRIPVRVWRGIHLTSFVLYVLATLHFVTAGTDVEGVPGAVAIIGSMVLIAALTLVRILAPRGQARGQARGRAPGPARDPRRVTTSAAPTPPTGPGEPAEPATED
jgi:predicted ferric reductase